MLPPRRRPARDLSTALVTLLAGLMTTSCAKHPAATFEVVEPPPPRIESVTHGAPSGARPGDTVSITMKGDPGMKASASLGTLAANVPLSEDAAEKGLYRGSVLIPDGKSGTYGLTGTLAADRGPSTSQEGPSLNVLAPPPTPPPPKKTLTAADLNAQKVLRTIYFDLDKSDLRADALEALAANAMWLKGNPTFKVVLEGHCDERATNEYNMALGDRRAAAAKDYLANAGIDAGRLRTVSYGEERPAEPGHTEEAWAKNRRVEFVLED